MQDALLRWFAEGVAVGGILPEHALPLSTPLAHVSTSRQACPQTTRSALFRAICEPAHERRKPASGAVLCSPRRALARALLPSLPDSPPARRIPRARDRRRALIPVAADPWRAPTRGTGVGLAPVARGPLGPVDGGREAARRGARGAPTLGREALRTTPARLRRRGARAGRARRPRRCGRRARGASEGPVASRCPRACRRLQPAPYVRPVRDRRVQPARPCRGARGRRDAGARVQ